MVYYQRLRHMVSDKFQVRTVTLLYSPCFVVRTFINVDTYAILLFCHMIILFVTVLSSSLLLFWHTFVTVLTHFCPTVLSLLGAHYWSHRYPHAPASEGAKESRWGALRRDGARLSTGPRQLLPPPGPTAQLLRPLTGTWRVNVLIFTHYVPLLHNNYAHCTNGP